jgi:hypothetical protein
VETYAEGCSYDGDWIDGSYNGNGILIFSDDRKYIGEFKDGLRHGKGKYTSSTREYDGEWENDKRSGKGIEIFNDGRSYDC